MGETGDISIFAKRSGRPRKGTERGRFSYLFLGAAIGGASERGSRPRKKIEERKASTLRNEYFVTILAISVTAYPWRNSKRVLKVFISEPSLALSIDPEAR